MPTLKRQWCISPGDPQIMHPRSASFANRRLWAAVGLFLAKPNLSQFRFKLLPVPRHVEAVPDDILEALGQGWYFVVHHISSRKMPAILRLNLVAVPSPLFSRTVPSGSLQTIRILRHSLAHILMRYARPVSGNDMTIMHRGFI